MFTRDEALNLLKSQNPETNQLNHALESEAVMRALAARLSKDAELWGLTGLLHDLDFPKTKSNPSRHGLESMAMLEGNLPADALHAIRAHNGEMTGTAPENEFDFALRCAETVTGLVAANALVRPGKMSGMEPKSLKKKMKEKSFAANVSALSSPPPARMGFTVLARDAVVHLGDSEYPAPWVPLYLTRNPSTVWTGEFYLRAADLSSVSFDQPWRLTMELMQVNDLNSQILVNDQRVLPPYLADEDFTSIWVAAQFQKLGIALGVG